MRQLYSIPHMRWHGNILCTDVTTWDGFNLAIKHKFTNKKLYLYLFYHAVTLNALKGTNSLDKFSRKEDINIQAIAEPYKYGGSA